MCGIVAILSDDGSVAEPLGRAVGALGHRGPDGQACWVQSDGRVGIGHTRLGVIDLETGGQPIANETGDLHLAAAGEFYDFESMRAGLVRRGHRFATGSDSEIALHLYEEYGVDCLSRLHGEFAFVIWDERRRTLFAARDRFGIKPLYYAHSNGTTHVGTEAKALLAAGVPARWDHVTAASHLFFCMDPQTTLFRDIAQVPPGHYLLVTPDTARTVRYWDLDFRTIGGPAALADMEYAESLRERIDEAVRLRMRADVPVGCYLSGGLDSTYALSLATKHATRPVTAFTVSFSDGGYDERAPAREAAGRLGVPLHEIPVAAAEIRDHFSDAVWHGEGIHYNLHGVVRYLLARGVRREGWKVVLAGEGADECFAGYAFCQGALGAGDRLDRVHGVLNLLRRDTAPERLIRKASPWLARAVRFQGLSPEWLDPLADQLTRVRSLLAPERANADADLFGSCFARIASGNQLRDRAPVHRLLYLWMKSVFANYILGAERMDMAHAVEVRLPFLDSGVFDFARRLPASVLARGPMEKHILRLAAHPAIGACAERPKQPFYVPFSGFGRSHPLYSMAQDTLRSDLPSRVPFLEPHAGVRLADRIATGDGPSPADGPVDATVLMLLSVCILQQRYGLS